MNGRDRLLAALNHQEPDRVPFDLGSTQVTGIHTVAYRALRDRLELPPVDADPLRRCARAGAAGR